MSIWKCPVCGASMQHRSHCWSCPKGHSFDIARSGYVNLLPSNQKRAHNPGDNPLMVRARKAFLDAGYYSCLLDALKTVVIRYGKSDGVLLDVGCGEGYYTEGCAEALKQAGMPMQICGVDIAKCAVDLAAKRYPEGRFAVASAFHLPVSDACCDIVTEIFAPRCIEEYSRVLHQQGIFIQVLPGQQHLWGLKEAIYDSPYPNAVHDYTIEGMELLQVDYVDDWLQLDNPTDIQNLFQMTPYYYKTGREEHARLEQLDHLSTQISFEITQYRKKKETTLKA